MPLVAIVGRPNVGKSTLFNRMVETRQSIVHDEPGVTRDRLYGQSLWNGRFFSVVDTGGYVPRSSDRFEKAIREQVDIALTEADVILFVLDVLTGVTDLDWEMADILRGSSKPVILVVNKADNEERRWESASFYELGFEHLFAVSSINGSGTGDLLDTVVELLPDGAEETEDERTRIAFIGKPNVGKSSLTNALLGEERSIVTEISGTTRDSIDSVLKYHGEEIVLVDTAGLRRKSRVTENVEFYSALRTERAIASSDVSVLILDAENGLEAQDIKVLVQAAEMMKGLVIAVNKWDLIEKQTDTAKAFETAIRERLQTLSYIPIVFVSAITKQRVSKLLDTALTVAREREKRVSTSKLNDLLQEATAMHHPPSYRGQHVRIKYMTQVRHSPPVFTFFCNHPKGITESYRRYLENKIRGAFGFDGVPVKLVFKAK